MSAFAGLEIKRPNLPRDEVIDSASLLPGDDLRYVIDYLQRYERSSAWYYYLISRNVDTEEIFAVLEVLEEFLPEAPKFGRGT